MSLDKTGGIINVVNHCAMGYVNKFKHVEVQTVIIDMGLKQKWSRVI